MSAYRIEGALIRSCHTWECRVEGAPQRTESPPTNSPTQAGHGTTPQRPDPQVPSTGDPLATRLARHTPAHPSDPRESRQTATNARSQPQVNRARDALRRRRGRHRHAGHPWPRPPVALLIGTPPLDHRSGPEARYRLARVDRPGHPAASPVRQRRAIPRPETPSTRPITATAQAVGQHTPPPTPPAPPPVFKDASPPGHCEGCVKGFVGDSDQPHGSHVQTATLTPL